MRIIHSADWQIGKVFKQFGAKEEPLRQARLAAIERLGAHAKNNGVSHILVAGDVYDSEAPNPHTLRAPIERMKPFAEVHWHLLPGNRCQCKSANGFMRSIDARNVCGLGASLS